MNSIVLWALALVAGFVGRYLAGLFAGSCPASPADWLCVHWETVAGIASAILAALGYGTARKVAARVPGRAVLKVVSPPEPVIDATVSNAVPPAESAPMAANDAAQPDPLGDHDAWSGP